MALPLRLRKSLRRLRIISSGRGISFLAKKYVGEDSNDRSMQGAKDAIRWFDSMTLYTLWLTVRLVFKLRLMIDG